jgi:hypothetical protein
LALQLAQPFSARLFQVSSCFGGLALKIPPVKFSWPRAQTLLGGLSATPLHVAVLRLGRLRAILRWSGLE